MSRKKRSPEEQARRAKIRELLQASNISSMEDTPFRLLRMTCIARLEVSHTRALSLPLGVTMWIATKAFSKNGTSWGKEKQTEWLSFRACTEAKDTQFVSTQDRLPWLGLKAVETTSMSCESCQALSALFPIAGARAANTAEKKTIATILATTKGKKSNFEPA